MRGAQLHTGTAEAKGWPGAGLQGRVRLCRATAAARGLGLPLRTWLARTSAAAAAPVEVGAARCR